jgi:hypothetical protein
MGVTPHVAQSESHRRNATDGRTTRHKGYQLSHWKRKLIEKVLGWMKTVGVLRKTRHRGTPRVGWMFIFCLAAFDLLRIRNLEAATAWWRGSRRSQDPRQMSSSTRFSGSTDLGC